MLFSKPSKYINRCNPAHGVKIKIGILISVIGLLAGCVSEGGYQRKLERSVGMSKQELISEWGEPSSVSENDALYIKGQLIRKEATVIFFHKVVFIDTPGTITLNQINKNTTTYDIKPKTQTAHSCSTRFWLENDQVVSYKYEGNNCVAY